MKKIKKIPEFRSITEEARFWDTHDVSDYLSEMKKVKLKYNPRLPKEELLTIRIQSAIKKRLIKIAKNCGISLSTLLRTWFIDKIKENEKSGLVTR